MVKKAKDSAREALSVIPKYYVIRSKESPSLLFAYTTYLWRKTVTATDVVYGLKMTTKTAFLKATTLHERISKML